MAHGSTMATQHPQVVDDLQSKRAPKGDNSASAPTSAFDREHKNPNFTRVKTTRGKDSITAEYAGSFYKTTKPWELLNPSFEYGKGIPNGYSPSPFLIKIGSEKCPPSLPLRWVQWQSIRTGLPAHQAHSAHVTQATLGPQVQGRSDS